MAYLYCLYCSCVLHCQVCKVAVRVVCFADITYIYDVYRLPSAL